MTQNLLISEPPLQVLPSLAVKVGLNEAIVLQQFHYWLQRSTNVRDGYKWVYNSYKEWNKQFPFWGLNTLKRAITSLEKSGYLISGNYNKAGFDKTKWYRINYDLLGMGQRSTQNGSTMNPEWVDGTYQNGSTNTNRLPENTTIDKKGLNHVSNLDTECIQPVSTGKVRLGKVSKDIDKHNITTSNKTVAGSKESAKDKKTPRPKHKKRVYDKDSDYYKLSEFFISQIKKNNPNFKDPNIQKWSNDFRLMIEIDKRDKHEVAMLIKWVQKDSFWMSNVLSPAKLREKYDQLIMRMANSSEPHVLNQEKPSKPKNKIDNKKKDELLKEARERDKKLLGE